MNQISHQDISDVDNEGIKKNTNAEMDLEIDTNTDTDTDDDDDDDDSELSCATARKHVNLRNPSKHCCNNCCQGECLTKPGEFCQNKWCMVKNCPDKLICSKKWCTGDCLDKWDKDFMQKARHHIPFLASQHLLYLQGKSKRLFSSYDF